MSFTIDHNGILTGYTGAGGAITIPANVLGIGVSAFRGNTAITSVTFDSGSLCKYIGNFAFQNCINLTSIDATNALNLITIGISAFNGCGLNLTLITFPKVTIIEKYAFFACTSLTTLSFPAATTIGFRAFHGCTDLLTPNFSAVTTIDNNAFDGCTNLTTPNFSAATTIGFRAFFGCTNLSTPDFSAATTIGNNAFEGCTNLLNPDFSAATTIGNYAFSFCTTLTTSDFSAVTTIGNNAFDMCLNLSTPSFPAATTIGNNAFSGCAGLTALSFPAAITIYPSAFFGCTNLTTLIIPNINIDTQAIDNTFNLKYVSLFTQNINEPILGNYGVNAIIRTLKINQIGIVPATSQNVPIVLNGLSNGYTYNIAINQSSTYFTLSGLTGTITDNAIQPLTITANANTPIGTHNISIDILDNSTPNILLVRYDIVMNVITTYDPPPPPSNPRSNAASIQGLIQSYRKPYFPHK